MTHQKKPHVHAKMMKAYADDVSLCVFIKCNELIHWEVSRHPSFDPRHEYLLCLPKHRDAALNALNGGEVQVNFGELWQRANCGEPVSWMRNGWYMSDDCESRIKPKKEKRWISYNPKTLQVYNCEQSHAPTKGFQVIEIETEI